MAMVKGGGFWTRATAELPAGRDMTPESLEAALREDFGQRYEVYRSKLLGVDVAAKKSSWTGVSFKIKQKDGRTRIAFGPFAPSAAVRGLFMGALPMIIVYYKAWKPMQQEMKTWFERSPRFM